MQNLILSEVGDVRATYDVSESDCAKRSSKVDLADAVGSTGVGAILGVGISGLVQIVRHKKTGVAYAMKTLRLGRLEDFHKVWRFCWLYSFIVFTTGVRWSFSVDGLFLVTQLDLTCVIYLQYILEPY